MLEVSVDVDNILNLKHKAVIQALLTTQLRNYEIANKLHITRALFYYIANRYLPKGYLVQRSRSLQLEDLRALAADNHSSKSPLKGDSDEVTILSIPSQRVDSVSTAESTPDNHSFSVCDPPEPRPHSEEVNCQLQSCSADLRHLSPRQLEIYWLLDRIMTEEDRDRLPPHIELERRGFQEFKIHISHRDIYAARATWIQVHPAYSGPKQTQQPSIERNNLHQMTTITLEYKGVKMSWQTTQACKEVSILKIIQGL